MKRILTAIALGSLLAALVLPIFVSAQAPEQPSEACTITHNVGADFCKDGCGKGGDPDACNKSVTDQWGMCCMLNSIYTVTNWIFYILLLIVVIMVIIGGFTYLTASGDPEKAGKGKTIITYSIIGMAIALLAKLIPSIVRALIGM